MKLIGMLDSPYVRRVAISLQLLELPFEHEPLSVFRTFDQFREINPVVKAPTLVCDDGTVLMDSTLILDYAECLARPLRLMPAELPRRAQALRLIGLALAACEKSVQIVYELNLRPAERQHAPWLERVRGQMQAAYGELEQALADAPQQPHLGAPDQAMVSMAVAWQFTQQTLPGAVDPAAFPRLHALSEAAEALPAFRQAPHGDGVCRVQRRG
ncbi:glutathione S-transferase [Pelomonas sp. CA6]|uniref:glutathione S-transferase family protein n=1 Tax=Pelomonas sp. CA6 TaxID=2907999 RepID=UPI001F4C024B|nr:glutathione S-transferase [Pelomonas sp. CA6]MCH7345459.1 glutathione S-transferase [Pelomonas sp. CA6]